MNQKTRSPASSVKTRWPWTCNMDVYSDLLSRKMPLSLLCSMRPSHRKDTSLFLIRSIAAEQHVYECVCYLYKEEEGSSIGAQSPAYRKCESGPASNNTAGYIQHTKKLEIKCVSFKMGKKRTWKSTFLAFSGTITLIFTLSCVWH